MNERKTESNFSLFPPASVIAESYATGNYRNKYTAVQEILDLIFTKLTPDIPVLYEFDRDLPINDIWDITDELSNAGYIVTRKRDFCNEKIIDDKIIIELPDEESSDSE